MQAFPCQSFLTLELGVNQIARDFEPYTIAKCESLGTPQSCVAGCCWPGHEQDLARAAQQRERSADVREPLQSAQRQEPILRNADKALQPVTDARECDFPPFQSHAILDFQMAALHAHLDPETMKCENAGFANWRFVT
jgi:hypothetical protein